jgi:hypothetical protein
MADTDKLIGSVMGLYVDGTKVAETTNISYSGTLNVANVTSSDSEAEENLPTYSAASVSFDYLEAPASTNLNFQDLEQLQTNKTKVTCRVYKLGDGGGIDEVWIDMSGYLTDISADMPFDGAISGSGTITRSGTGSVTDIT